MVPVAEVRTLLQQIFINNKNHHHKINTVSSSKPFLQNNGLLLL